ncbi:MAG: metallophosphoesterase [Roseiflexaceae bacterium]
MRILTVSDEVVPVIYSLGVRDRFGDVSCVLGCGDLPYYYLEFLVTTLAVPCFYVLGNHDANEQTERGEVITEPRGCTSIEGRTINYRGIILAGLGGCLRYNNSDGPQYTELQMLIRFWRLAPQLLINRLRYGRSVDIMLTHAPPLGIHNGPDRPHKGFRTFLTLMDWFEPQLLIHGHIHRSYGFSRTTETRYKSTEVLNTAGYRVIDVEPPPAPA